MESRITLIEAENILFKSGGYDMEVPGQIQKIEYYRIVKPPSLKQFIHRKAVAQAMKQVQGETGVGIDPDTRRPTPISAIKAKELLKGVTAEDLMRLHPDWIEDYRREHES